MWDNIWEFCGGAHRSTVGIEENLYQEYMFNPVIPLLGIYLKQLKSETQREIYTSTFIAALFTIAKMWTQSKCPLMNKLTQKM